MSTINLMRVLEKYGDFVVDQSKKNLATDKKGGGALYNSISYEIDLESNFFLVDFLMEDYGQFVDKGVQGMSSSYPETQAAQSSMVKKFQYGKSYGTGQGGLTRAIYNPKTQKGWLKKKKFQWRDRKTGRFLSYETMSYLIARSIYQKGLKANLFFTKPFEKGLKDLPDNMIEAYALDIETQIILGQKQ
tara:strand:+ start:2209 stop:2775 length:567 start_codon:yes stop_codon:yes gene_type:complete